MFNEVFWRIICKGEISVLRFLLSFKNPKQSRIYDMDTVLF